VILALVFLVTGIARIASTYPVLSQAYDEPAHIACGMEWISQGTYTLEPLHPPLARVATAIGPYLEGLRMPAVINAPDHSVNLFATGNEILNGNGKYFRTLTLARLGVLPFFVVVVAVVFFWTRKLFGDWAAAIAVLLLTTLPPILAFFGLAYTDPVLAALVPCSLFAFSNWLEDFKIVSAILLGVATGLAILSKFTALLFLPPCFLLILVAKWGIGNRGSSQKQHWSPSLFIAVLVTVVVIWAGFRFSVEPLPKNPQDIVALRRLPAPLHSLAVWTLELSPRVPAPALFKGLDADLRMNSHAPPSYLLGNIRRGGWWYFFLVVAAVKTPIPFLLLTVIGAVAVVFALRKNADWRAVVPIVSILAMLIVTMPAKINYGVRHILVIYPLAAILAGAGGVWLWKYRPRSWPVGRVVLLLLLAWQVVSTARSHPDYLSYFNEAARGKEADYLLWGCDLDCGQDTYRLAQVFKQRGIDNATICLFTSADTTQLGLSDAKDCVPYRRVTGWVAGSVRLIRTGDEFLGGKHGDAYSWLSAYPPVQKVGKTILLYYIRPE
jgi:hypothetical protein